jgi:hypothetical protein
MKVHKYQIEVMWVFLASMFCPAAEDIEVAHTYNNKRDKSVIFKEPCYHKRIRPPPSGGGL